MKRSASESSKENIVRRATELQFQQRSFQEKIAAAAQSLRGQIAAEIAALEREARQEESSPSAGPFRLLEEELEAHEDAIPRPMAAPTRRYECKNYERCLEIAAALNWESFSCKNCPGEMNEQLIWQAHSAQRHDAVSQQVCDLPTLVCIAGGKREPE
ncbi:hypothetical protein MRY87_07935 [bacterium]|nr:hypothetical protein [bacterium]